MMSTTFAVCRHRAGPVRVARYALLALAALPLAAPAAWDLVTAEQGKRVEIDRSSIVAERSGETVVRGRIVLDKPIVDPKTSVSYRIIEIVNRFNCTERTHATVKRSYYKDESELLRQEEVRTPFAMPVRSGTPDDKLLRETCRPKGVVAAPAQAVKVATQASAVAGELRKLNEELIDKEVRRDLQRLNSRAQATLGGARSAPQRTPQVAVRQPRAAPPATLAHLGWAYAGAAGPDHWSRLKPEYALCASGRRQSPIDIGGGIAVDLEAPQLAYRPAAFRVADSGRNLQIAVYGGGFSLLGKSYELQRIHFHRPAEYAVAGKHFEMDAQLVHKSEDGKIAIVTVLFERGVENALVQQALNHLPLERGGEVAPPSQRMDVANLFSSDRRYATFIGSLTSPPCTEEVLWLVMKDAQQVSAEQLAIFARLYPPNARPLQPAYDRIIKESR